MIPVFAILGIVAVESVALCMGINGTGLAMAVAAISGLGGYSIGAHFWRKKGGEK